jgi:phosphoserine phosphatase
VFDGDGTVMGQVPHYLADECLYAFAKKSPGRKPEVLERMRGQSNVSLPYVQNRVHYLAGESLAAVREMGDRCFEENYSGKIYAPMKELIGRLKENGFEVWIITASPEALYQKFLSRAFGIPVTSIVGVKSVVRNGLITDEIVRPVPQDHGKKEAIETFVQEVPLFAAGNSRGDKEMIEFSRGLRLIVNPDTHLEAGEKESIRDYAERSGWLVAGIPDLPEAGFPRVSGEYGVRENKPQGARKQ